MSSWRKPLFFLCLLIMMNLCNGLFLIPMGLGSDPGYIIEGDVVYVDNAQCRIEVYPHILSSSGYAYLNITSKQYTGEIDFVFGFDTELVKPKSLDLYKPHNVTHNNSIAQFFEDPDYEVEYNYTSNEGFIVYNGYVWVYEVLPNMTRGELFYEHHFDWADFVTKMIFWNTLELWEKISDDIHLKVIKYDFLGVDTWYKGRANVTSGVEYHSRYYLEIAPKLGEHSGKYWVAFKPHMETLHEAIQNNHFYYLDPWFNVSFAYRKSHNITGTTVTNTSDIFSDDFEDQTFDQWDEYGATEWEISSDESRDSYSAHSGSTTDGFLVSDSINLLDSVSDGGFECWIFKDDTETDEFLLYFWDGSEYDLIIDLDTVGVDDAWLYYSLTLNSTYQIEDFHVNFTTIDLHSTEHVYVDDIAVNMTYSMNLTNYQVRKILHFGTGTSGGEDVYLENHSQSDFDDVRFVNNSNSLLDYWREEYFVSDNATFWIEIDFIPFSPNNVTIWIYYGNGAVGTTSNGVDTFILFDDFEDGDYSDWSATTQAGWWSLDASGKISGTYSLKFTGGTTQVFSYLYRGMTVYDVSAECKVIPDVEYSQPNILVRSQMVYPHQYGTSLYAQSTGWFQMWHDSGATMIDSSYSLDTIYILRTDVTNTTVQSYFYEADGTLREYNSNTTGAVDYQSGDVAVAGAGWSVRPHWTDDIRVRNFVEPEPINGDWSDEETAPIWTVTFYHTSGGTFRVDNITLANGTTNQYSVSPTETVELLAIVDANTDTSFTEFFWGDASNKSNPALLPLTSSWAVWCFFDTNASGFARFNTTVTTVYDEQSVFFDASMSDGKGGEITNYSWDFGDGNVTSGNYPNITHSWDMHQILNENWDDLGDWVKFGGGTSEISPAGQLHQIGIVGERQDIAGFLPSEYIVNFSLVINDYSIYGQGYEYQFHNDDVYAVIFIRISEYEITNRANPLIDKHSINNLEGVWYNWSFVLDSSVPELNIYRDDVFLKTFTVLTYAPTYDGRMETEALLGIEGHEDYMRIYNPNLNSTDYVMNLTVTDAYGRNSSFVETISVRDYYDPSARFNTTVTTVFVDQTLFFNGSMSTSTEGSITDFSWDFGDGNVTSGNHPNITHSWGSVDVYPVNLTVTSSFEKQDVFIENINVTAYVPVERGEYLAVLLVVSFILIPLLILVIVVALRRRH